MRWRYRIYRVRGDSMAPTLRAGDWLLTRSERPGLPPIKRGDIVIAAVDSAVQPGADSAELGSERRVIKRVIGLPNEHVLFADGMLFIDGERLTEPYLRGLPPYPGLDEQAFTLGRAEYFVMGDNRARSTDSRHYGPVAHRQICGRVITAIRVIRRIWRPPLLLRRRL